MALSEFFHRYLLIHKFAMRFMRVSDSNSFIDAVKNCCYGTLALYPATSVTQLKSSSSTAAQDITLAINSFISSTLGNIYTFKLQHLSFLNAAPNHINGYYNIESNPQ